MLHVIRTLTKAYTVVTPEGSLHVQKSSELHVSCSVYTGRKYRTSASMLYAYYLCTTVRQSIHTARLWCVM